MIDDWNRKLLDDLQHVKPTVRDRLRGLSWRATYYYTIFIVWMRSWGKRPEKQSRYVMFMDLPGDGSLKTFSIAWGRDLGQPLRYELASVQSNSDSMNAIVQVLVDGKLCYEAWAGSGSMALCYPVFIGRSTKVQARITGGENGTVYLWTTAVYLGPKEMPWSPLARALRRLHMRLELVRSYGRGLR